MGNMFKNVSVPLFPAPPALALRDSFRRTDSVIFHRLSGRLRDRRTLVYLQNF
jgi:hypothetical protein